MAFVWTSSSIGKPEEALNILKAGMEANPTSFLLHFAYAEVQEARKEFGEVNATFDKILDRLRAQLEDLESRVNSTNSSFSSDASGRVVPTGGPNTATIGLMEATSLSNNTSFATQSADEKPPKSKELQERRSEYGLVWTMYIRYARRAHDLKTFRAVFAKARKDRWTPWEVYEAAGV